MRVRGKNRDGLLAGSQRQGVCLTLHEPAVHSNVCLYFGFFSAHSYSNELSNELKSVLKRPTFDSACTDRQISSRNSIIRNLYVTFTG